MPKSQADEIRSFAEQRWVVPARKFGDSIFTIVSGEVHRSMGLRDRMPNVCSALGSKEFLERNRLTLVKREGPPSGKSSTVRFTYAFLAAPEETHAETKKTGWDAFLALRGLAKGVFERDGGGEAFLRKERAALESAEERSMPEQDGKDRR